MRTARLSAIRRYLEKNLADPSLGPDGICREFGMSGANLYRLFEPIGGVHAYIRERRVARAFADLVSPTERRRIGDVAYNWGFGSEASFSRRLRCPNRSRTAVSRHR
jgi:AraC-like DNA-binding protein